MSSKFNPKNNIIGLCIAGMAIEDSPNKKETNDFFDKAWNQAIDDFEKFIAAYYLSKSQHDTIDKLKWMETALHHALQINDDFVKSSFPSIYLNIANCYKKLGDSEKYKTYYKLSKECYNGPLDKGPFYHGTKASLNVGDLLLAGNNSNYDPELKMNHVYFTSNINVASLAADLAKGNGLKRVYIIEPTGTFEDDPNAVSYTHLTLPTTILV